MSSPGNEGTMKGITTLLLLLQATTVNTASHSLWAFATIIHGETQFPEFSLVVMVDGVQVLYYDSNLEQSTPRLQQNSMDRDDDAILKDANFLADEFYTSMTTDAYLIRPLVNHTDAENRVLRPVFCTCLFPCAEGVHVYQRLTGCELDNEKESNIMEWDAYDGVEATSYNMQDYSFNSQWPVLMCNKEQLETLSMDYTKIYQPVYIRTLKYYLKKVKNVTERPRVTLLPRTHAETGEMKVSCLATGFHPRHINLTMLRDGHPIPEEELILGALLPNGDGTYQLRRTLSVGAEELRERHHYTCSVTHLSLDNKLDISCEPADGPNIANITTVSVVILVLIFAILVVIFEICKRRFRGSQTSLVYTAAAVAETEDSESSSVST